MLKFTKWPAKNYVLVLFVIGVVALSGYYKWRGTRGGKLNIFILSIGSFRRDAFFSDKMKRVMPNLSNILDKSVIFTNGFSERAWGNVESDLNRMTSDVVLANGYEAIGRGRHIGFYKDFGYKASEIPVAYSVLLDNSKLDYGIEFLVALLKQSRDVPFVLSTHISFLKPPFLSNELREMKKMDLVDQEYRGNPSTYFSDKKPFLAMLSTLYTAVDVYPRERRGVPAYLLEAKRSAYSYSLQPSVVDWGALERWMATPNFDEHIKVLEIGYTLKMARLDERIGALLEFISQDDSLKETVIVIVGDHGTARMEHGRLLFGSTVYDEMLGFPLAIRFPEQTKRESVDFQVTLESVSDFVFKVMEGKINGSNFIDLAEKEMRRDLIFSRNCTGNELSVRYKNKWKLIHRSSDDSYELYDLIGDPKESENVYREDDTDAIELRELLFNEVGSGRLSVRGICAYPESFYSRKTRAEFF